MRGRKIGGGDGCHACSASASAVAGEKTNEAPLRARVARDASFSALGAVEASRAGFLSCLQMRNASIGGMRYERPDFGAAGAGADAVGVGNV